MYLRGDGVRQSLVLAAKWFRKAADQGNAYAQYDLGMFYKHGRGVPQDLFESATWFRAAAKQGHTDSCFQLGEIFRKGSGARIPVSTLIARKYLRRAADKGHAGAIESMKDVCRCTFCGSGGAMRLCGWCWEARYCGPECQRKHWNSVVGVGVGGGGGAAPEKHKHTCPQTQGSSRGGGGGGGGGSGGG
mmetsp:Transcript_6895/g.17605  ORF Transcript_6895/g.17605 Transcript_6895/m.17605 type:complete len:189 (+) Transcript_6895:361-927(+)